MASGATSPDCGFTRSRRHSEANRQRRWAFINGEEGLFWLIPFVPLGLLAIFLLAFYFVTLVRPDSHSLLLKERASAAAGTQPSFQGRRNVVPAVQPTSRSFEGATPYCVAPMGTHLLSAPGACADGNTGVVETGTGAPRMGVLKPLASARFPVSGGSAHREAVEAVRGLLGCQATGDCPPVTLDCVEVGNALDCRLGALGPGVSETLLAAGLVFPADAHGRSHAAPAARDRVGVWWDGIHPGTTPAAAAAWRHYADATSPNAESARVATSAMFVGIAATALGSMIIGAGAYLGLRDQQRTREAETAEIDSEVKKFLREEFTTFDICAVKDIPRTSAEMINFLRYFTNRYSWNRASPELKLSINKMIMRYMKFETDPKNSTENVQIQLREDMKEIFSSLLKGTR